MKKARFPFAGLALAVVALLSFKTNAQSKDDTAAVRATVETYLHGLKFNDVDSFKKAFYPDAKLFFVRKNGELGELSQENWYKGFTASAGKEEKGELRIESVDVTADAASVKVVEIYPDSVYTDYVSLLKLPQGWKIVNKIFTSEKHSQ
jgi:hypothetical protein